MSDLTQRLKELRRWFTQSRREQQRGRTQDDDIDAVIKRIDEARTYQGRILSNFRRLDGH